MTHLDADDRARGKGEAAGDAPASGADVYGGEGGGGDGDLNGTGRNADAEADTAADADTEAVPLPGIGFVAGDSFSSAGLAFSSFFSICSSMGDGASGGGEFGPDRARQALPKLTTGRGQSGSPPRRMMTLLSLDRHRGCPDRAGPNSSYTPRTSPQPLRVLRDPESIK